jgi:hypothetical protein
MITSASTQQLRSLVEQLRRERQAHVDAIREIDEALGEAGAPAPAVAPKPVKTAKKSKRKPRGQFSETAAQFVQRLIRERGPSTTAEVNTVWKQAGRGGFADTTLSNLVKDKVLRREPRKSGKGSVFSFQP